MKEKPEQGIDFYYNEKGQLVFTEHYHLSKGYCCGLGCLHCPFDHVSVPVEKRSLLKKNRNTSLHAKKKEP